jgi:hypothetical protein
MGPADGPARLPRLRACHARVLTGLPCRAVRRAVKELLQLDTPHLEPYLVRAGGLLGAAPGATVGALSAVEVGPRQRCYCAAPLAALRLPCSAVGVCVAPWQSSGSVPAGVPVPRSPSSPHAHAHTDADAQVAHAEVLARLYISRREYAKAAQVLLPSHAALLLVTLVSRLCCIAHLILHWVAVVGQCAGSIPHAHAAPCMCTWHWSLRRPRLYCEPHRQPCCLAPHCRRGARVERPAEPAAPPPPHFDRCMNCWRTAQAVLASRQ